MKTIRIGSYDKKILTMFPKYLSFILFQFSFKVSKNRYEYLKYLEIVLKCSLYSKSDRTKQTVKLSSSYNNNLIHSYINLCNNIINYSSSNINSFIYNNLNYYYKSNTFKSASEIKLFYPLSFNSYNLTIKLFYLFYLKKINLLRTFVSLPVTDIVNFNAIPNKQLLRTVNRSPHKDKRSREHFNLVRRIRLISYSDFLDPLIDFLIYSYNGYFILSRSRGLYFKKKIFLNY